MEFMCWVLRVNIKHCRVSRLMLQPDSSCTTKQYLSMSAQNLLGKPVNTHSEVGERKWQGDRENYIIKISVICMEQG
jgi:hypothetical protein